MLYFDNNATTPLLPEVKAAITEMLDNFGNASSVHQVGQAARSRMDIARRQVAELVGVRSEQVVFTGGGTEANNMVLKSAARDGRPVITQKTEHSCVMNSAKSIVEGNHPVVFLDVDSEGLISLEDLESALKMHPNALVSLMHANNETGVMQPLKGAYELCQKHGALLHSDAIQTGGKIPLSLDVADIVTLSFHKLGAPKGVGALVFKAGVELEPLLHGGRQERGYRSGTENTIGIVAAGVACEKAKEHFAHYQELGEAKLKFEEKMKSLSDKVKIMGEGAERLPVTSSIALKGMSAEMMVMLMDMQGVCISQGSACASGRVDPSHVIEAMGFPELALSTVRMASGWHNTPSDYDTLYETFEKVLRNTNFFDS